MEPSAAAKDRSTHSLTHSLTRSFAAWISRTQQRESWGRARLTTQAGSDSDSDGASEPWELVEEEEEEEESNPDLDGVASVSSESDSPPVGHLHSRSPSPVRRSFSSAADEPPMVAADSDDEDFARQLVEQVLQRWCAHVPQTPSLLLLRPSSTMDRLQVQKGCGRLEERARKPTFSRCSFARPRALKPGTWVSMFDEHRDTWRRRSVSK